MLIRLILAATAIAFLLYLVHNIRRQAPEKRPRLIIKYGLWIAAAAIFLLVIFGKVHWITAGVAAVLPLLYKLFSVALRAFPMMQFLNKARKEHKQGESQNNNHQNNEKMTLEQAKEIFGFKTVDSIEKVTKRHRELMQKMHPDRGGSDYLAAQINQAKDILIEYIKKYN